MKKKNNPHRSSSPMGPLSKRCSHQSVCLSNAFAVSELPGSSDTDDGARDNHAQRDQTPRQREVEIVEVDVKSRADQHPRQGVQE